MSTYINGNLDNSSEIIEDIKWKLFDDPTYENRIEFVEWCGDNSFIVTDGEKKYKIMCYKEIE